MITANAVLLSDDSLDLSAFGIDTIPTAQAESYLTQSNPSVIAAHCRPANFQSIMTLLLREKRKNPSKRFIVLHDQLNSLQLCEISNLVHPQVSRDFRLNKQLPQDFEDCFRSYYELEQNKQLVSLVNDKNEELKRLTVSLEDKIEDRQQELEKSRLKNISAEKNLNTLKKILIQTFQAGSINEIEQSVTFNLQKEFKIAWVQIRQMAQSNLAQLKKELKIHNVPLKISGKPYGHLLFAGKSGDGFDTKTKRFFNQVAEVVSLSIERTVQYNNSQMLKTQWEATFDAISDPICLTDENYNILRINSSFLRQTKQTDFQNAIGRKCYQVLFSRESTCEGCQRGQIFQLRNPTQTPRSEVYDVYSNSLAHNNQPVYFQMYRNVTNDLNLQRQVIESAKMAELGTISSSIAHELNNPIGGMLNFIQLMKMDLDGSEDFYPDILEIEKGIIKCKNIVKNLLGFARKSFHSDVVEVDLNEVIEQAIKITELKTRSIGIIIDYQSPSQPISIDGRFNLLTHAIRNVLQNSQESLVKMRQENRSFQGKIIIRLNDSKDTIDLTITDNGDGLEEAIRDKIFDPLFTTKDPETNSGLGLTLALQIAREHNGTIMVSSGKDENLSIHLRFFKSEVQSGPSDF